MSAICIWVHSTCICTELLPLKPVKFMSDQSISSLPTISIFSEIGEACPLWSDQAPFAEYNDSVGFTTLASYGLSADLNETLLEWLAEWSSNFIDGPDWPHQKPCWKTGFSPESWHRRALLIGSCIAQERPGYRVYSRHMFYLVSPSEWRAIRDNQEYPEWFTLSASNDFLKGPSLAADHRGKKLL